MSIKSFTWYLNRLASMSSSEIWHRICEQIKRTISSFSTMDFSKSADAIVDLPVLPGLAEGLSALTNDKWLLSEWKKIAESVRSGNTRLLGMEWPDVGTENRWSLDPQTGKLWPQSIYCYRIRYRHASDMGDVKYVWELNRLQYLQPIAALAAVEANVELARFCACEIESWIDNNPPYKGINWVSGIELSSRLVSIFVVTSLIGEDSFTTEQRGKIQATLAAHGYWLNRYPSRFSSANNHLIAEASGLFLLGNLAPWLPESKRWVAYGRNTLISEVNKQIYEDGVGAEQSPTYLAFTLEWLLLCAHVGKQIGQPFPDAYWRRIESAGEFLKWITDSSGNQPRIGDDDEGRVFFSQSAPESYVSSLMGCISNLTGREELSPPMVQTHLREAIFGRTVTNECGPSGAKCFKHGGYTVFRSICNGADNMLIMDHGPLGYLSIAAHGHADTLAIWLHIEGHPVLVDAGTYLYHSGKHWRDHMRSTPAHNTLSVCGSSSSQISGAFNWTAKACTTLQSFMMTSTGLTVEAEHDGFAHKYGVRHQRHLECHDNGAIEITDTLHGEGAKLEVEIGFLFHPRLDVKGHGKSWTIYDHGRAILGIRYHGEYLLGNVQRGLQLPPRGWYSSEFGHKTPTSRLAFNGELPENYPSRISMSLLS